MVAAGVYLLARIFPILDVTGGFALPVIAWIGAITAIFAATIAFSQNDIKKGLAYSTCSQLGYMVLAVGLGAPIVAMFHLITHAMFKAMLFLGSGSVIMGCHHVQDMREMGGLRKYMPITAITFLIGTLSISGMPFFSGFWSKDMIIAASYKSPALFIIATVTAFMTAFYMFRIYFKTFEGKYRGHAHPHEQPWVVTLPLMILAVPSIFLGLLGSPLMDYKLQSWFDHHFHAHGTGFEFFIEEFMQPFGYLPFIGFILGTLLAVLIYLNGVGINKFIKEKLGFIHAISMNKWYIDEIFNGIVAALMFTFRATWKIFERVIIEGLIINGILYKGTQTVGDILKFTQSGKLQNYIGLMFASVVIFVILFMM
jgi:NAD(P)H-quinone oxidoreductase subunit 5